MSQRPSRRTVHYAAHMVMTQLRLKMGQGMRVTLETRVDHVRMRKSRVHHVHVGHVQTYARIEAALDAARRRIVVVLPLAVVIAGGQLASGPLCLRWFRRGCRLSIRVLPTHVLRVGQLVVLLPLHPTVLEPDLYLPLGQHQGMGDLDPSPSRQVPIVMELLLQFEDLMPRVCGPLSLRLHPRLVRAVRDTGNVNLLHPRINHTVSIFLVLFLILHHTRGSVHHLIVLHVILIGSVVHVMLLL